MDEVARELLVLRHAKSDWSSGGADFARTLAPRGHRDAPRMARLLSERGLVPDHVVSSPARRAEETTRLVTTELGFPDADIDWDPRVYEATVATLLAVLAECPGHANRVLLVGHNPGLEGLVRHLARAHDHAPEAGAFFPTAALAHLRLPRDWSDLQPGVGGLDAIYRPKHLA